MRTTQSPGRSASFGGPGFLDGELGGGVRLEALVRNRLAAADGPAIGAVVQPVQGALDGVKPVAQALGDRVILPLGLQRLRGVAGVSGLTVHLRLAVLLARRLSVLQQALHLVALGNEQAARAVLVHKAVLPQS